MSIFVKWWQKEKDARKFNGYSIFRPAADGCLHKPRECFLDLPFEDTGLKALFDCNEIKMEKRKYPVWKKYKNIEGFHKFAKAVGVMHALEICDHKATEVQKDVFRKIGNATSTTIDKDFFINALEGHPYSCWHDKSSNGYLGYLKLNSKIFELSRAVWLTMCHADNMWRYARYLPNNAHRDRDKCSDSFLCNQLKSCAWVPDKEGHFLYPRAVTKESLHPDFPMDNIYFLKAIEFGSDEEKAIEEKKLRQESNINAAKEFGVDVQLIPMIKQIGQFDPEVQATVQRFINDLDKPVFRFPEKTPKNPERRRRKIQEKVSDAPQKKTEKKERTVNTSKVEIDAQSYLKNLYTNSEGVLSCQLCHAPMPFKKRDGEYYMEAVEITGYFSHDIEELYLALCPNCSAKYKYFVKQDDKAQQQVIAEIRQTDYVSIPLLFDETKETLRFVETHLADLKAILEALDADHE